MDRPEDRNATQKWATWPGGATLAELEEFTRALRERGAPDDAHPAVKVNEAGEITGMVCVVERAAIITWENGHATERRNAECEAYAYGNPGTRL